jgi:sirohydrochlorin ferrochelatase
MLKSRIVIALIALGTGLPAASFAQSNGPALSEQPGSLGARGSGARGESKGILLLAHGGSAEWNAQVTKLVSAIDRTAPTEVAFGMATRANIQSAVDRLQARGATEIVAVPLFISSWSSVITSTEYLLGQRAEAPPELAVFAKMNHDGHHGGDHGEHVGADAKSPVRSTVPIRMTAALNDHPIVAAILASRARSISQDAAAEALVIVAHGPVADAENLRWLDDMKATAARIGAAEKFASIDYMTLRDDAPKPVRDQATAELRALVTTRIGEGRRVLIVPLLVSFGGIERGLRERLDGLAYTMPAAGLVPDERLVSWVLAMAGAS